MSEITRSEVECELNKMIPRARFYSHVGYSSRSPIHVTVYQWNDSFLGRLFHKLNIDMCGKDIGLGFHQDLYGHAYLSALKSALISLGKFNNEMVFPPSQE